MNLLDMARLHPSIEPMSGLHVMQHGPRAIVRHLPGAAPHIVHEGALWTCRNGARYRAGYGYTPTQALREWGLMNNLAGKPAGAAQEAPTTTPRLMAHLGNPEPHHHV